nr:retrovirus-related Pol polyprotein from transposon TNT 1-94 [Tanacetum cinerariifolium]
MSETVPPIPPPLGTNTGSPNNPNFNRVDMMPNIDTTNTSPTINVSRSVVDDDLLLPQLLDSRGGSHITIVPMFDKDDFTSWKIRDIKIAASRLKFNVVKALKGEKVNGTYTRLKCLLNDLKNNGVIISQSEDSDSDVEEDNRTSNEFMVNLNVEYHERALLANQKRFYKRSERVGSARKPIDKSKETCFACGNPRKGDRGKSDKGLVAESFDWDDESVSSEDKGTIKFNSFMAIAEDEPLVGKGDARYGQWVDITMKKDYLKRSVWYLDSGCSRHMTRVKQYLQKYSKEFGPKVVFGDNYLSDTKGYGSVNCNGIIFTKVAYVNGLKHNLISISQLCDANFKVLFTKTQGTIFDEKDEVVHIAPKKINVYVIDMSSYNTDSNACFYAKASPSVNWL